MQGTSKIQVAQTQVSWQGIRATYFAFRLSVPVNYLFCLPLLQNKQHPHKGGGPRNTADQNEMSTKYQRRPSTKVDRYPVHFSGSLRSDDHNGEASKPVSTSSWITDTRISRLRPNQRNELKDRGRSTPVFVNRCPAAHEPLGQLVVSVLGGLRVI